MKQDLKLTPGVKAQIEIPKDLHHRIHMLAIHDSKISGKRCTIRDKLLDAILMGIQHLEKELNETLNY